MEAVDQEAAFFVHVGVEWADDAVQALLLGPVLGGGEEGGGGGRIVDAIKEAKERAGLAMAKVIIWINNGRNSADIVIVTAGHPELYSGVFEEGIGFSEHSLQVALEGRHPAGIPFQDSLADIDKPAKIRRLLAERDDLDGRVHAAPVGVEGPRERVEEESSWQAAAASG